MLSQSQPASNAPAIIAAAAGLAGAFIGGLFTLLAQWFIHRATYKRERRAELRRAYANFATAGFAVLTAQWKVEDAKNLMRRVEAKENPKDGPDAPRIAEAAFREAARMYMVAADQFQCSRSNLVLIEPSRDRRQSVSAMFESNMKQQPSEIPTGRKPDGEEIQKHFTWADHQLKQLMAWLETQADRSDL